MNADFKLKLLRSAEIFETSEKALKYIEKNLEDNIAEGEPAIVFYGEDTEHPNVILCIGNGKEANSVYTIDFQSIKDELATLSESEGAQAEELATAVAKIEGILKAVDLSCNTINGEIVISYDPDPKDIVIGDAETIADALAKLSAYAQKVANEVEFVTKDTNTVALVKEDGVLSANVKFSELGDTSVAGNDDNIVGAFDDGVYAVAYLDYEDETKTITFTTSGYDENGAFKRDANVTTIKLGEHTLYKADNEDHNLKVTIDNTEMTISADAKISDDSDNILTVNDGKLYVKGRASNIIYRNSNVRDTLDELYKEVAEAGKNTEYIDTDTIKFTTKEDANGELNVSADVKLASNNSISIDDGGLNVNLTISVNAAANTLTVKLGNVENTYDLPDAKIIDHIEFKDNNLILWYDNDKSVYIPMEGLVAHYVFENDDSHTVYLDADKDSDGIYHVYAMVKLRSSDNLISHNSSGELFVSKEDVETIVSNVTDGIIELLKTVGEKVDTIENQMGIDETTLKAIQAKVEDNATNIATNASDITSLKKELSDVEADIKVDEEKITTLTEDVKDVKGDVEKVQTEVSTNTTNIALLNAAITTETEEREKQDSYLKEKIDELSAQVSADEESILTSAKEYTDTQVEKVQTTLDSEIERAKATEKGLQNDIDTINDNLAKKIETVTVRKINELQYEILVNGNPVDDMIDIPNAIILYSASYDPEKHELKLIFRTTKDGEESEQTITVDLSTLVDVYEAGNGLTLDDNKFSIDINTQSQPYLTVDGSGLALTGVASAKELEEATDELQEQIKTLQNEVCDAGDGLEKVETENGHKFNVQINTLSQSYLTVDGSGLALTGVASAKELEEATDELQEQIKTLQNEVCDAGDGLEKVETENGHKFNVQINTLCPYLTVDSSGLSLSGVADANEFATTNENVAANTKAIEDLSTSVSNDKFHTANTSTIELTMKAGETSESSKELSAKVILSSQSKNNIVDNGGLYSVVDFDYNSATNVMTFTNSNGTHEFTINTDYTLVEGGYYDSTNHAVVLIVKDSSGVSHEISIPIKDLIYDIGVHNDVNDPVELEITTDAATGAKVITATLRISNVDYNLIDVNNGALFASNRADGMYCDWEGETQTIQFAIYTLWEREAGTTSDIAKLQEQVETNTTNIQNNTKAIEDLQATTDCLGDICSSDKTIEQRLEDAEATIADLTQRLAEAEAIISNLIDFGDYNITE